MKLDQVIELAKMQGWRVYDDSPRYISFPFCRKCVVRLVVLLPPPNISGGSRYLYEPLPNHNYEARYLTEIRKNNAKLIERIRKTEGFEDIVAALDFCT